MNRFALFLKQISLCRRLGMFFFSTLLFVAPAFAKPIYAVDKAIQTADRIVLGEIYKVEMLDAKGSPIIELKSFATQENNYKIKNHIRVVEQLYGEKLSTREFVLDRPIPAYYGKEALRKGLKLFYFLKKDGTPIDGTYEFNSNRRPRILKMLKERI